MAACPEPSSLDAFALGSAGGPERTRIEQHIDGCASCSGVVAELMRIYGASAVVTGSDEELAYQRTVAASGVTPAPVEVGRMIGRYRVTGRLGEGGMGAVLAAHDPELDRPVALKMLHADAGDDQAELRERLAREARAMAKLAHPNVVAVFDVGSDPASGKLFVAMELVIGQTLRDWLRTPRREREILDVFIAAGTGLAAAHTAGLVHRDFKPENVLVGQDGRVRVGDFGLARPPSGAATSPHTSPYLTRTGAIIGTPAYMAPEQFLGEAADARSDQFAFAVALFEAMRGTRPFAGRSLRELQDNVVGGRLSPAASSGPRWQRALFARALARDRAQRYPSMAALLDVLAREPGRAKRVATFGAAIAGSTALVSIALFWGAVNGDRPAAPREPAEAEATPPGVAPPAANIRAEVERLRGELASADDTLRSWTPNFDPTKIEITKIVERARALGYEPLLAEALLRLGRVETRLERPKRAQTALEEAVTLARGSRHDALLYDAIIDLVEVVGVEQGLAREADTWIGLAVAESKRQPADARRLARLELATGRTRLRARAYDDALVHLDRALEQSEKAFGERSREAAEVLRERARSKRAKGDASAGLVDAKKAADIAADDPILSDGMERGLYRLALGELLLATGDRDGAIAELERADEALVKFGRASSAQLAISDAIARGYHLKSDSDKAMAAADKALAGFLEEKDEKLRFHDPSGVVRSSTAIDIAQRIKSGVEKRGDLSEISDGNSKAAALAAEGDEAGALRGLDDVLGRAVENPALVAGSQGAIRYNLALLSLRKGDLASASSHIAESLSALEREVGDDHLRYGVAMALEARILERQGSPRAADRAAAAEKLIALRRS